jgi:hypothetical protein
MIYWRFLVRQYASTKSMVIGCDIQISEIALMGMVGQDSAVGIMTRYELDGPGIESWC